MNTVMLADSNIDDIYKFWSFLIVSVYFYVNHLIVCLFIFSKISWSSFSCWPRIKGTKENKNTEKIEFIDKRKFQNFSESYYQLQVSQLIPKPGQNYSPNQFTENNWWTRKTPVIKTQFWIIKTFENSKNYQKWARK